MLFILLSTSGRYMHLSIVVHYKTVCNNNELGVNDFFIKIIKWMLLWYIKATHTPTPKPNRSTLYFPLFDYLLNFIENKCLSDLICDVKREKNEFSKRWIRTKSSLPTLPTPLGPLFSRIHTSVDGVSVNSLSQQGGLFALSVNRHSVKTQLLFLTIKKTSCGKIYMIWVLQRCYFCT